MINKDDNALEALEKIAGYTVKSINKAREALKRENIRPVHIPTSARGRPLPEAIKARNERIEREGLRIKLGKEEHDHLYGHRRNTPEANTFVELRKVLRDSGVPETDPEIMKATEMIKKLRKPDSSDARIRGMDISFPRDVGDVEFLHKIRGRGEELTPQSKEFKNLPKRARSLHLSRNTVSSPEQRRRNIEKYRNRNQ